VWAWTAPVHELPRRTREVRLSTDLSARLQDLARGKAPNEPVFSITAGHLRYELQLAGQVLGIPIRGRSVHGFRYDYAVRRAQKLATDPDALEQGVLDLPGRARADCERLRAAWRDADAIDRIVSEELSSQALCVVAVCTRLDRRLGHDRRPPDWRGCRRSRAGAF
jgi:hypothetical protein